MTTERHVIFVRPMEERDEGCVDALLRAAREESRLYRGEIPSRGVRVPGGMSLTLVAGIGETVLGTATLASDRGGEWWLEVIHVDHVARGVGIGDAIMRHCLEVVAAHGATRLCAAAQPGDRSLKNLFERHGLVARTILVGRDI
jgi:GNAT superfamily N-acetyltransferase